MKNKQKIKSLKNLINKEFRAAQIFLLIRTFYIVSKRDIYFQTLDKYPLELLLQLIQSYHLQKSIIQ